MPRTTRSTNIDLIRWLNYGHDNTAKKLAAVINANYLSKMATGDMEVTDKKARQIEKVFDLPAGWLDRDNIALLKINALDFDIHKIVLGYSDDAKNGLLAFISDKS